MTLRNPMRNLNGGAAHSNFASDFACFACFAHFLNSREVSEVIGFIFSTIQHKILRMFSIIIMPFQMYLPIWTSTESALTIAPIYALSTTQ